MKLPLVLLLTAGLPVFAFASPTTLSENQTEAAAVMTLQSTYPVVVTDKLVECRDFYTRQLGFRVVFEASWYVHLASGGEPAYEIAFMSPEHPSQPPGPETFNGKGLFLTLQVADATAQFKRLEQAGVAIAYPLKDEPWGQRRFGLIDPAGLWLDVVQQTEPAPGYWDAYPPSR